MADGDANFEEWLCSRLKQIGLDDEVFGSYVTGVMDEEDSTDDDRKEALAGILEGMTDHPLEDLCSEILQRWASSRAKVIKKREEAKEQKAAEKQNELAEIMEKHASTVNPAKSNLAKVDKDLKEKLLAQYSHQSDEEHCSDSDNEPAVTPSQGTAAAPNLFKNTNTQSVLEKEKEKKDKLRKESEQKKQQIKDAKEQQKQKADDRKEKEKKRTQKGERRTR